jgi:hypothetical protein
LWNQRWPGSNQTGGRKNKQVSPVREQHQPEYELDYAPTEHEVQTRCEQTTHDRGKKEKHNCITPLPE